MGARIAAHIANAGHPVLLLDLPSSRSPQRHCRQSARRLEEQQARCYCRPFLCVPYLHRKLRRRLPSLKGYDWIIEAVAENLEIKRGLLGKVIPHLHPAALLTTNTSGLPVAKIAEEFTQEIRRRWFGTHFFNPPRYMRLLEIIATPETDQKALAAVEDFADLKLGKTVVAAKDVAELDRQPDWDLRAAEHISHHAGAGPHDRGSRCADRIHHRVAQDRHIPAGGYGRYRCAGERGEKLRPSARGRAFGREGLPRPSRG